MKPLFCAVLASVFLAGATIGAADAEGGGRKRWKHHRGYDHGGYYSDYDRGYYRGYYDYDRGYFSHREVVLVREYYRPRYRALAPGLRKQYYRRGYLPPGWQRRIEPYPVYVEREVIVLPHGYHRGILDGHAVIYNRSGLILDVAVLF